MHELLLKAVNRLRADGLIGLIRATRSYLLTQWHDRVDASLDRKFQTETRGVIRDLMTVGAAGPHAANATIYEAIQIPVFRAIMRALPIDPARYTFIDFGSGKGRAVLLAALRGFKRVVGIEFVPALHAIAEDNAARIARASPRSSPIELRCEDAAHYQFPAGDTVCFLYNPFDETVMGRVLGNLERALSRAPRSLWVVYRNPIYAGALDRARFLELFADHRDFRIYRGTVSVRETLGEGVDGREAAALGAEVGGLALVQARGE